jgi:hypothetical protein
MVKEGLTARICADPGQWRLQSAGTGLEMHLPGTSLEKVAMVGDRRKSILGGLLLVVLFAAVFYASWIYFAPKTADQATGAPLAGTYGALALSEDTGNFGASWGFKDASAAEQRSLQECQRNGGQNCVIKTSLAGNCSSLVMSPQARQSFVVTDPDKFEAAAFGLAQCQASGATDCAVKAQFCSNGG